MFWAATLATLFHPYIIHGVSAPQNDAIVQPLTELAARLPAAHDVGPDTEAPLIVVDLRSLGADPSSELAGARAWLTQLPCPVVAIASRDSPAASTTFADTVVSDPAQIAQISVSVERAPVAAMTFVQVLRIIEHLDIENALLAESMAFGVLQGGGEFQNWLAQNGAAQTAAGSNTGDAVALERRDDVLVLRLNRSHNRNAINREMRDALTDAFDLGALDDTIRTVRLEANGKCFSVGGDLSEFGQFANIATAHWVRSVRAPARAASRCADKLHAHLHGACIGAGIEIPAFARTVTAATNTFVQLPELSMGLLPGSGGCVSLSRRIGRQKTAWLGLTGRRINATMALSWGLIDSLVD